VSKQNIELVRASLEAYQQPEMMAVLANGELDMSLIDPELE
jgi:hypothetical protein